MNKSMLTGLVAGISVATAGGVAGYAYLGQSTGSQEPIEAQEVQEALAEPSAQAAMPAVSKPATATPASRPAPTQASAAPVEEECWDEEVTVQADPRDDKAIAGTAAGAVIGGAVAKKLGDDNDALTAAGAAAGAFFGRKAQKQYQENKTTTTVERRCAPAGTR